MKKLYTLLTVLIALLIYSGCDEPPSSAGVTYNSVTYYDIECCNFTCGRAYIVTFDDVGYSGYYWLALVEEDDAIVVHGPGQYFDNPSDQICTLSCHYFDIPLTDTYEIMLYRSADLSDVGIMSKRESGSSPKEVTFPNCINTTCAQSCCTDGYGFAEIIEYVKHPYNTICAARCIMTTNYGASLCSEQIQCDTTIEAHSVVLMSVLYDTTYIDYDGNQQNYAWSKFGYGKKRFSYDNTVYECRITETQGYYPDIHINVYDSSPIPGTMYEYKMELDNNTGLWSYYNNGNFYYTPIKFSYDPIWASIYGNEVRCGGEVKGLECDMAGLDYDKCIISNCAYKTLSNGWYSTQFMNQDTIRWIRTDPTHWMVDTINDSTICIWDAKPQP